MKYFLYIAILLTSCAQATPQPTQIVFITPTKGTAIKTTDEPLPFRNLATPSLTPTKRPPTNTPAPVIATSARVVPAPATATSVRIVSAPTSTPPTIVAISSVNDVAIAESNVMSLINANRSAQRMPPLARSESIMAIARTRSNDMVGRNYFGHNDPISGASLAKLSVLAAGFSNAGENIYWSGQWQLAEFPNGAVNWFMNSAAHRANILGSGYTHIGAGIVWNGLGWMLTVVFAGQ
ncbi:MAG: CAP domain-containing protein [Chloroflexota bacterium]